METDAEKAILWASIEDYPALWQLASELQGMGVDEEHAYEEARAIADRLVRAGALRVGIRRADSDDMRFVADEAGLELIADPDRWRIPEWTDDVVAVDATDAGKARYEALFDR